MEHCIVRRVMPNQIVHLQNERNEVMNENPNPVYPTHFDLGYESNLGSHANKMPPVPQHPYDDGIEVIDLDNPRGQIKPTTWHK